MLYHRAINTHVKITFNSFALFIQNTDHKLGRATTDRSNALVYILLLGFRPFGATGSQENDANNRILQPINGLDGYVFNYRFALNNGFTERVRDSQSR